MRASLAFFLISLSLSGCALHGDEAALKEAALSYNRAMFAGKGTDAHTYLSARCQQEKSLETLHMASKMGHELYGPLEPQAIEVHVNDDKVTGWINSDYGIPALDEAGPGEWLKEGELWKNDAC